MHSLHSLRTKHNFARERTYERLFRYAIHCSNGVVHIGDMLMLNKLSNNCPSGSLHDNYQEVLYWTLRENHKRVILLQILGVLLLVLAMFVFSLFAISIGKLPSVFSIGVSEISIVILAIPATIVAHELTHGIAMQRFGANPHYGVLWKQAVFYSTSPGYAFHRNNYIVIALAPIVVISVLALLGMWIASGTFWVVVFTFCGIINASGSLGDLWLTVIVARYAVTAYVIDEKDGIRVFLPQTQL